jgi:hypothetical protein
MSEENKETTGQATTTSTEKLAESPQLASVPQQARPSQPITPVAGTALPQSKSDDDEDVHPDTNGLVTLPIASFTRRVQRETKKNLRELFGTDNLSSILEMKKELDGFRNREEEERKKNLAEIDRIREEASQERAAREAAEARAAELELEQLAEVEDRRIRNLSENYVKPKYYKHAASDLREYLLDEFGESGEGVTRETIVNWFKQYVEDNPEMGLKQAEPTVAISNGTIAARPTAPSSGGNIGKTPRPGHPNSMSNAEYRALLRDRGLSY